MILNDLFGSGLFSSFSCTISSTLLIVYRIYNSLSRDTSNHSKKRFMHVVDVLVQSAAAYSIAILITAIVDLFPSPGSDTMTLSMFAVLNYECAAILYFVSVCNFGAQIRGKV